MPNFLPLLCYTAGPTYGNEFNIGIRAKLTSLTKLKEKYKTDTAVLSFHLSPQQRRRTSKLPLAPKNNKKNPAAAPMSREWETARKRVGV